MTGESYRPRVDLYVRSLCPGSGPHRQAEVIERLDELDEADRLADVSVHVWGECVPREGSTTAGTGVQELVEAFEAWSDRAGASLSSFFETAEAGSMLADETRRTILLPVRCLAEYCGDRLAFVAPCVDDGTVCTVSDRLDALDGKVEGDADG